mgnify:CR=1 FL=1
MVLRRRGLKTIFIKKFVDHGVILFAVRAYTAHMARAGADRAHTAMLGDKLLTDMLAANRAGVLALMVEPVGGPVTAWQKVLHALQAPFKAVSRRHAEKIG